eukprot:Seg10510.1 transcript_id=Seg10510.1/GoldUCD/mRNA.D3Y31 product="hypothetical protein" protein_id=Seg10510.1/GoldUCD/D3Y31
MGTYECRATNVNVTVTALSNVTYWTTNRKPEKFRFQIEEPVLRKKKELIIGTSANLSCTYRGDDWEAAFPYKVYFSYMKEGKFAELLETTKGPKKIRLFQVKETGGVRGGVKEKEGSFKIGIYRINYTDSRTYKCAIRLVKDNCPKFLSSDWIARTLTVSVRKLLFSALY